MECECTLESLEQDDSKTPLALEYYALKKVH